jgi:hypothetical protein
VGYRSASGDRSSNWTTDTIRVRGDKDFRRVSERVSRQIYAEGTAVDEAIEVTVTYDCLEARAVGVAPFWLTVDTKTSKP